MVASIATPHLRTHLRPHLRTLSVDAQGVEIPLQLTVLSQRNKRIAEEPTVGKMTDSDRAGQLGTKKNTQERGVFQDHNGLSG